MIRKYRSPDLDAVMSIWLEANLDGHPFINEEYWRENYEAVKELLETAKTEHDTLTLNVYQRNERAIQFYRRNGFVIDSESVDEATGEAEYIMRFGDDIRERNIIC